MSDFDQTTLIAQLSPNERQALPGQTDAHGLRHVAGHFGAIIACATLIALQGPFWPELMLVQGALICFLFATLHETVGAPPFKTPALHKLPAVHAYTRTHIAHVEDGYLGFNRGYFEQCQAGTDAGARP